jgi:60 kDa SS-A/Ro ribonucleoprotein
VARLVREYRLPREAVPTQWLNERAVWDALLEEMPLTAMIRNLATMTRGGLLEPMSEATRRVTEELANAERIRKARVHPIALLSALMTYKAGRGVRGQHTWTPVTEVVDALDSAFYLAFGNVEPTNQRVVLALDVSSSMEWGAVAGVPGLTPRVASAAMALVTAATEPKHTIVAFSHEMVPLTISPKQRLDDVVQEMSGLPFGATDCALPMLWALGQQPVRKEGTYLTDGYRRARKSIVAADAFVIYTDNETWFGAIHPSEALKQYRRETEIPAKLAVVGMTATQFSIADPEDGGMLDVVGFDSAAPQLIADFVCQSL